MKVMAVLSVSLSKNNCHTDGKRIYFDRQSVFDLSFMSTDQEEKKRSD